MPAKSKSQQRFMGMVHGLQKGTVKSSDVSGKVKKTAKSMKKKDAEDYASTKHKGLPNKVRKEMLDKLKEIVKQELEETFYDGTKKFEKKRTKSAEVLGYTLTGTPDVKADLNSTKDEERVLKRMAGDLKVESVNEGINDKMKTTMTKLAKSLGIKSVVNMYTGKGSLSYMLDDDREAKKLQKFLQRSFKRVRLIPLDKSGGDEANWVVAADMLGLESVNEADEITLKKKMAKEMDMVDKHREAVKKHSGVDKDKADRALARMKAAQVRADKIQDKIIGIKRESVNEDVGMSTYLGGIVQALHKAGLKPKTAKQMKHGFSKSRDKIGFFIDVEQRTFGKKEMYTLQVEVDKDGNLWYLSGHRPIKLGKWADKSKMVRMWKALNKARGFGQAGIFQKKESVNESKRCTVKEVSKWLKTLEEFRYRKVRPVDARRVASFVNRGMNEEDLPMSLRKKWEHRKYGRERHLAEKYLAIITKEKS